MQMKRALIAFGVAGILAVPVWAADGDSYSQPSQDNSNSGSVQPDQPSAGGEVATPQEKQDDQYGDTKSREDMGGSPSSHSTMGAAHKSPDTAVDVSSLSKSEIRNIQKNLNSEGFDAGPTDGVWSDKVAQAVGRFQESRGISSTGVLDYGTLSALNVKIDQNRQPAAAEEKTKKKGKGKSAKKSKKEESTSESKTETTETPVPEAGAGHGH